MDCQKGVREKGFGRERGWILRVVWLKFEQLALPFEPFEAIGGETIVCKKGEGGGPMDPFAQISGESNGPWWKVVTRRGLLSCSINGYSIQTPPPPPPPPLFYVFVNFSRRTILKAGTNIQRLFVGYFLKIYIYLLDYVDGVKGEKFLKARIWAREPSSTKRLQDFLSDIEYDETFDIRTWGERNFCTWKSYDIFFFSIEY